MPEAILIAAQETGDPCHEMSCHYFSFVKRNENNQITKVSTKLIGA